MPQNDALPPADRPGASKEKLEALRRDIDRLDDAILALVEQRVAAAMDIAELKRNDADGRLRLRPAREAAVVERLVGQARASPERLVRSIWREIMSSCLDLQVHTELALHAGGEPAMLVDAVRRRFGAAAELMLVGSPIEALDAARDREAVAVIELQPSSSWWAGLRDDPQLAIFDCLRDEQGRIVGLCVGRIVDEDLRACPNFRIVEDGDAREGELLASSGGFQLLLAPERRT
jgi:chorismate mutase